MSVAPETSGSVNAATGQPLVSAGSSDRCPVCGAQLAVDQRYCVECGTRRGAPRFQLASQSVGTAAPGGPTVVTTTSRFARLNANSALLVGLLILLVALGVGVLIGHNGNAPRAAGQPKVTVNLNGASSAGTSGGTASSGAVASTSAGTSNSSASTSTGKKAKATKSASKSTKAAAAATNPNASATGKAGTKAAAQSFSKTATKKSTLGGSCTAGTAGCKGGKQTGNLF